MHVVCIGYTCWRQHGTIGRVAAGCHCVRGPHLQPRADCSRKRRRNLLPKRLKQLIQQHLPGRSAGEGSRRVHAASLRRRQAAAVGSGEGRRCLDMRQRWTAPHNCIAMRACAAAPCSPPPLPPIPTHPCSNPHRPDCGEVVLLIGHVQVGIPAPPLNLGTRAGREGGQAGLEVGGREVDCNNDRRRRGSAPRGCPLPSPAPPQTEASAPAPPSSACSPG
jgi:hypothetical protein